MHTRPQTHTHARQHIESHVYFLSDSGQASTPPQPSTPFFSYKYMDLSLFQKQWKQETHHGNKLPQWFDLIFTFFPPQIISCPVSLSSSHLSSFDTYPPLLPCLPLSCYHNFKMALSKCDSLFQWEIKANFRGSDVGRCLDSCPRL